MSDDKERLAAWMMKEGFATGHGDTAEQLLEELSWQIAEIKAQRDELLEALCYLHATSTGLTHEQWLESMSMAEAAIAKARGERKVLPSPHGPDSFTKDAARAVIKKQRESE